MLSTTIKVYMVMDINILVPKTNYKYTILEGRLQIFRPLGTSVWNSDMVLPNYKLITIMRHNKIVNT